MGQGFTVNARALSAGGREVAELVSAVESAAGDAVRAISGMAGSVSGHAGLASALAAAADSGARTYLGLGVAYRYAGESLAATAGIYDRAEQACVARISRIGGSQ